MYKYIYIYTYMYKNMYTYIYIFIHVFICIHDFILQSRHRFIHMYIYNKTVKGLCLYIE